MLRRVPLSGGAGVAVLGYQALPFGRARETRCACAVRSAVRKRPRRSRVQPVRWRGLTCAGRHLSRHLRRRGSGSGRRESLFAHFAGRSRPASAGPSRASVCDSNDHWTDVTRLRSQSVECDSRELCVPRDGSRRKTNRDIIRLRTFRNTLDRPSQIKLRYRQRRGARARRSRKGTHRTAACATHRGGRVHSMRHAPADTHTHAPTVPPQPPGASGPRVVATTRSTGASHARG